MLGIAGQEEIRDPTGGPPGARVLCPAAQRTLYRGCCLRGHSTRGRNPPLQSALNRVPMAGTPTQRPAQRPAQPSNLRLNHTERGRHFPFSLSLLLRRRLS